MSANLSPINPEAIPLSAPDSLSRPNDPARSRVDSIDLLRGIVMVIMMLDHTRDFAHTGAFMFDPTDLSQTTPALFFTRWITHYCAPVFVFLAGTGIYLQLMRGKSKSELSKFLIKRGLWLIVLELTVVKFGVFFNLDPRFLGFLQVIWVIGVSMIVLAGLIHLPLKVVAGFGLLMIFLHNLLDRIKVEGWGGPGTPVPGVWTKLWILLHEPFSFFPVFGFPSPIVMVIYNLIPWVGVMAAGYAFGALYRKEVKERRSWLLGLGLISTCLFIFLRALHLYGEHADWSKQKNVVFTALSFLNTTKYPPSLQFLLMTLGPAMLALWWFESDSLKAAHRSILTRLRNALVTFGRVPLFFYLLQWYTAHLIAVVAGLIVGQPVRYHFLSPLDKFSQPPPQGLGFQLWMVYLFWIGGVLLLYPLCRWFAGVKARRKDWWLSYL
ncbi:MAG TPA: heparan-alpha-glucosaminide N-acetyltransferase domain-containing protein [Pyrinomonadaceae bacterium]|nr:heparan-alpha-glucosaminide N-acetyltransferase domain-containing protein [Pyrinomonadaceae bacterium]